MMDFVDLLVYQAPFPSTEVAAGEGKAQGICRICSAQPRRRFRLPDALLDKMRDALDRLLHHVGSIPPENPYQRRR
jgi:hypothetical protein